MLVEHVSWQSIFYVNLPIGLAAIAVTLRMVSESKDPDPAPIDWAGLLTFSAALFALVFGLVRGNSEGWGSAQIVGLLVGAVVLLVIFVVVERRQERPMLDLTLFRKPTFVGVSIVAFALSASIFAMFLYLTLFMQNILGYGPLEAGLRFLPITVLSFFAAALSGNLTERVPVRLLLATGLGLVGIGLLLMSGLDADSGWTALLPGFLLTGVGVGLCNPAIASTAVGVVEQRRAGHGLRRQQHVPPGRDRDRDRRPRRDLPGDRDLEHHRRAARRRGAAAARRQAAARRGPGAGQPARARPAARRRSSPAGRAR